MKVVILAGGYGTRIRDITEDLPKPMIPIGRFPILWHIMKHYAHWKHDDFVLCLGYKGQVIKNFFLNYEVHTRDFTISLGKQRKPQFHSDHGELNWQVTLADTGLDTMTGGRIKRIESYVSGEDNFMLTYGDAVSDVNLAKLLEFHRSHGKIVTLTGVHPPGRFGELMSNSTGQVTEFNEKPQVTAGLISGGFFVCRKEIFRYLDDSPNLVFEKQPMSQMVADQQVMVYEHGGFWHPMDTSRDFQLLNELWNRGRPAWKVW